MTCEANNRYQDLDGEDKHNGGTATGYLIGSSLSLLVGRSGSLSPFEASLKLNARFRVQRTVVDVSQVLIDLEDLNAAKLLRLINGRDPSRVSRLAEIADMFHQIYFGIISCDHFRDENQRKACAMRIS